MLASIGAVLRRVKDDVGDRGQCIRKRGGKRKVALNTRNVALDRCKETENLEAVRDKYGHAAGVESGGAVLEAVTRAVEVQIRR